MIRKSRNAGLVALRIAAPCLLLCNRGWAFLAGPLAVRPVPSPFQVYDNSDGIGVGIDLGTTNSGVAVVGPDEVPRMIPVPYNGPSIRSVVSFLREGSSVRTLVGKEACASEPMTGGAYRNVKRILGTGGKLNPEIAAVVPFVLPSLSGKTFKKDNLLNKIFDAEKHPTLLEGILDKDTVMRPEEISSVLIQTLKQAAEESTGKKVTRAVIGVPAYFLDPQRDATTKAAEMAGIHKVKLLREPEAAALAYGIGKKQVGLDDQDELVLVFDLGGGTYDVSILAVGGGVTEIISTSGDPNLGGSDFDFRIAEHLIKVMRVHSGVLTGKWSKETTNAVLVAAEAIRIYLSNNRRIKVALPVQEREWMEMSSSNIILPLDNETSLSNSTHVVVSLSRKDVEKLCKEEFQALLRPIREVAIMSGALLPGDSSPSVVDAVLEMEEEYAAQDALVFDEFYGDDSGTEEQSNEEMDSDIVLEMSMKQAKRAQQRGRKRARNVTKQQRKFRQEKKKLEQESINQLDDKVKVRDGISGRPISRVVLVGGATRMPGIGRLISALTGVVPQRTVNPDEAVALGCAVHASILDGTKGMGTVLNPMQAAILRAVAQEQGLADGFDDDDEFTEAEYF